MKTCILLSLLISAVTLRAQHSSAANTHLFRTAVIEEVTFHQAPLDEVIAFLREETRQGDVQVNFVIPAETNASERMVTLDLRNVKAVDVFATVLNMTGTRAEIKQNMVWIVPNS